MSEKIVTLGDTTFDEHVKASDVPVLVDFWAEWCGPCKMIAPILEEIAVEQDGKLQIAKLNIDENLDITRRYDVMSIPTLILFKDGEAKVRLIGAKPKGQLLQGLLGIPLAVAVDGVLPLVEGDAGEAVLDVQRRLRVLGFESTGDPEGRFGPGTRAAVEAFQHRRGLRVDGRCGPQTWETLVEAGYRVGDRFLYRRTPMLRGDDVAELQQRLCALGFDTGRVDGIFGDATAAALREFQQNAALPADGILGAETLRELLRVAARHQQQELVSTVRDRELLRRAPPTLAGRHIAVGEVGGLGTTVSALRRRLVGLGARVTTLHHPDDSSQAQQANAAGVDVYLALRLHPDRPGCVTSFYAGYRNESVGGRVLAEVVQQTVPVALAVPNHKTRGMSLPLLRETRMPAVIVELGPASVVVERGPDLADSLAAALATWATTPWD